MIFLIIQSCDPEKYLVAIPEQRDKVFSATRSPSRSFLAGPVTVATFAIGENSVPSDMCHSTLELREEI